GDRLLYWPNPDLELVGTHTYTEGMARGEVELLRVGEKLLGKGRGTSRFRVELKDIFGLGDERYPACSDVGRMIRKASLTR
ncbi:hypothetical protein AVEN_250786-1, partial [Araneus ventricosus]